MAIYGAQQNSRGGAIARQQSASQARQGKIQSQMAQKSRDIEQRGSKGSMLGSGLGLLGAVGLTMLTGGAAAPSLLGAMSTVASSPVLAGVAGGVGSYIGQRGNLTGTRGAAKELEGLVGLAGGGGRGQRTRDISAQAKGNYGGALGSLDDAALTQGVSRGLQIGSLAGGFEGIGQAGSIAPGTQPSILDWFKKGTGVNTSQLMKPVKTSGANPYNTFKV